MKHDKRSSSWCSTSCALLLTLALGCSNAKQGAVSGAAVGAISGLAIGSLTGKAGAGAAIGAVVGGVGGAVIGDQNRRRDEAATSSTKTPTPAANTATVVPVSQVTAAPQAYSTGQALGRLVGGWRVSGSVIANGQSMPLSGTARGTVDKVYFVRLDLRLTDPRSGQTVEATSVLSQMGGRNLEMTNSSSTSPDVRHFRGQMDESGAVFSFNQTDPGAAGRTIILRMSADRSFTADVWQNGARAESLTFYPGP